MKGPRRILIPIGAAAVILTAYTTALDAFSRPTAPPPILVGTIGNYNIVRYDSRFFGVLQGRPIRWGAPGYDSGPGIVIAESYAEMSSALSQA